MRGQNDWVRAVGLGRIQDKTRWTKALGEAVTVVYGDCTEEIGQSKRTADIGHESTGPSLPQRWDATGERNSIGCRPIRREVWKAGELMRGLWQRAMQTRGLLFVDWSSRRIPWCGERQVGKEDQGSLLA